MQLALLPFNVAEGTLPGLGRQLSNFVGETVRNVDQESVHMVSFLGQKPDSNEIAFVNITNTLMEAEWIAQFFSEAPADRLMDGELNYDGETITWTYRFHDRREDKPIFTETKTFPVSEFFTEVRKLIAHVAEYAGVLLPSELTGNEMTFGAEDPKVFIQFLEGYDAFFYLQQAQGRVAEEFSPEPGIEKLVRATEADRDFIAPYETLIQLCRTCAHMRIGSFEMHDDALKRLTELHPDDFRGWFALGELYQSVNNSTEAAKYYEKALVLAPEEAPIYTRLGMSQLAAGMPVNAERNFRKALELEDDEKPSMDYLVMVLQQTGRQHEIPALWKELIEKNIQNGQAHAKYAISLFQNGKNDEGTRAFETALEVLEENLLIKRYYAPVLVQNEDLDRAMDFFEDCLDVSPNDIELLLEYAQTLQRANREFEIPRVLNDVLASNPDPNVRAQTLAWLIELEQPKRVEAVESARSKMEVGDFEAAVQELKPLRNWLADYWKLWALLSAAYNRLEQATEAEDAARRLLELFPACEPAYGELIAALGQQGRNEEAYNFMRFAASNMPGSLPVHLNLALAAKRAGHTDEARSLARQIREAVGTNEELEPVLAEIEM